MPEVVDNEVTGFIVGGEAQAAEAVAKIDQIDRRAVRARFEERFTSKRMAEDYVRHYATLSSTSQLSRDVAGATNPQNFDNQTARIGYHPRAKDRQGVAGR